MLYLYKNFVLLYRVSKSKLLERRSFPAGWNITRAKQTQNPKEDVHSKLSTTVEKYLSQRLEKAGYKRSKGFYGTVLITSVIVCAGGYLYFFPHKLRQQVVEEVSTVASQSLEDEKLLTKAGQLTKDVVTNLLNDVRTKDISSDFIKGIIVSQPIREAAITTILDLLNDPRVLELLRTRLSDIIIDILEKDSTRQIVMSQVNAIIQHDSVRLSLKSLLHDLIQTPEVQAMMADFFRDVLASETVKNQGIWLGRTVSSDVMSDKEVQERASNAIWSVVKYSLTPSYFRGKPNSVQSTDSTADDSNVASTETPNETMKQTADAKSDIASYDFNESEYADRFDG